MTLLTSTITDLIYVVVIKGSVKEGTTCGMATAAI
jgi:hypothetical protein